MHLSSQNVKTNFSRLSSFGWGSFSSYILNLDGGITMGIFDFFQKKTVGASDADAVDYSKLIEIARILSNDNKGLVDDATLMANDYEKFQQTYEKWCLEMWEDSLDNHNARLLTAAYWFVGYETSHQFGAYIDWKEETEDILWQLKSAIDSLGYSLNLDKIVFTGEEATDEALDKINAYFFDGRLHVGNA